MHKPQRHYSLDEDFATEEMSELRHEYFQGEIFAMSGGSRNHNQIAQNLARLFDPLRSRNCRAYLSDVRLKPAAGLYTYPDVMVICGPAALTGDRLETVTNPVVLAEVLSTSTADYDRGQKFELYSSIPTLRDYLLIDQYTIDVEHRRFDGETWRSDRYGSGDETVKLAGVPIVLRVDALYELVEFQR